MAAHALTNHQAWQDYKIAQQVETLAWELPVTIAALALGTDLPRIYLTAAAGTERAWQRYREVVRG